MIPAPPATLVGFLCAFLIGVAAGLGIICPWLVPLVYGEDERVGGRGKR